MPRLIHPSTSFPQPRALDHERLRVYQLAIKLDALVVALVRATPRGHADLCDQAVRASASTALNIAEAVGRRGAARARCRRIAHGSALETDAALTLLAHRAPLVAAERARARELSVGIVAMLVRCIERCSD